MKRCLICCVISLFLFCQTAWAADDVIEAEVMNQRIHLWDSQTVQTADGELRLAAYKGWVYLQRGNEEHYRKLVPGICPQWLPRHEGQTDRRFYVFLPVGYDGISELWIASTNGNYLGKATEGSFFVNSTPVLSPDAKTIATVLRPLARVQGSRTRVSVIKRIHVADGHQSTQEWIYEADDVEIQDLRFEDNDTISFKVLKDGEATMQAVPLSLLEPYPSREAPDSASEED